MSDLLKIDTCICGMHLKNTLMTTQPPVNAINKDLHEKLMLDQNMHSLKNPDLTVYVPGCDYEGL